MRLAGLACVRFGYGPAVEMDAEVHPVPAAVWVQTAAVGGFCGEGRVARGRPEILVALMRLGLVGVLA